VSAILGPMPTRRENVCPRRDFGNHFQGSEKERLSVEHKVLSPCCPVLAKLSWQRYCPVRFSLRIENACKAVTLRVFDRKLRLCWSARRHWALTYFVAVVRIPPQTRIANPSVDIQGPLVRLSGVVVCMAVCRLAPCSFMQLPSV
jgi:hypothetical protein